MMRLLLSAFFLEVGFVLAVVPWSSYWDRNYFAQALPQLHELITNNFVRGAVTGLGVVNIAVAVGELVSLFIARRSQESPVSMFPSHAAKE
jgi:hypothetical protein